MAYSRLAFRLMEHESSETLATYSSTQFIIYVRQCGGSTSQHAAVDCQRMARDEFARGNNVDSLTASVIVL
jgi:hypothetical protein